MTNKLHIAGCTHTGGIRYQGDKLDIYHDIVMGKWFLRCDGRVSVSYDDCAFLMDAVDDGKVEWEANK